MKMGLVEHLPPGPGPTQNPEGALLTPSPGTLGEPIAPKQLPSTPAQKPWLAGCTIHSPSSPCLLSAPVQVEAS